LLKNLYTTSGGPFWVRDLIIISTICPTPLIIRRDIDFYLFVGGCWLIDGELQGPGENVPDQVFNDSGTSSIMKGGNIPNQMNFSLISRRWYI